MAQGVICRSLAPGTRFQSTASLCRICVGQSSFKTCLPPSSLVSPLSASFHQYSMVHHAASSNSWPHEGFRFPASVHVYALVQLYIAILHVLSKSFIYQLMHNRVALKEY